MGNQLKELAKSMLQPTILWLNADGKFNKYNKKNNRHLTTQ